MRNRIIAGIVFSAITACLPLLAQSSADEVAQLKQRVAQLEKQVQEIANYLEPIKAQQARDTRMRARGDRFERRAARDRGKYTAEQMAEVENLYRGIVENWSSNSDTTRTERLEAMVQKYPDANRSGCATLDAAEGTQGDRRTKYLQESVEYAAAIDHHGELLVERIKPDSK